MTTVGDFEYNGIRGHGLTKRWIGVLQGELSILISANVAMHKAFALARKTGEARRTSFS